MDLLVRPAGPEDPCAPLLFASAEPYYTAYAGSAKRALKLLERAYRERGHAASYEYCRVALAEGEVVGLVAGFPASHVDRLSRRFVQLTFPRLPLWRWPSTFRHLRAAGGVSLNPPLDAYFVDALAVTPSWRRKGVAQQLLDDAQLEAAQTGSAEAGARHRPAQPPGPRAVRGLRVRRARDPARAEREDRPGARRPGLHRLPQGGVEHGVQRLGDLRHLALRDLREERQRDRPRGDVLADRELALAMAEALAVEGHQVDRRQVRLGLHAARGQRPDRLVAIDAVRQLDDEDEPAADVAAGVLARQLQPLEAGQRRAVPVRRAGAGGEHVVQAIELREPQRARHVGQPVVEAEPVVVEPVHVGRAALVALGVHGRLVRERAHREHPALARDQLLVGVEAERGGMAAAADRHAVGVDGAERLARVLDDRQPVALQGGRVGRVAEDVDRQQRGRAVA